MPVEMHQKNLTTLALTQAMIAMEANVRSEQEEVLVFTAGFNALRSSSKSRLLTLARKIWGEYLQGKDCPPVNQLFGPAVGELIRVLISSAK
jgi:hypothetical protein